MFFKHFELWPAAIKDPQLLVGWFSDVSLDLTKILDCSRPLFYFVPQEKGLIRQPPSWAWKIMGESIFDPVTNQIWPKYPKIDGYTCSGRRWTCQNFFTFIFQAVGVFFPRVFTQKMQKVPGSLECLPSDWLRFLLDQSQQRTHLSANQRERYFCFDEYVSLSLIGQEASLPMRDCNTFKNFLYPRQG